jgi:hypothetical protein
MIETKGKVVPENEVAFDKDGQAEARASMYRRRQPIAKQR